MGLLLDNLELYLDQHCDPENNLLTHIYRETHLEVLRPQMLSGHYQGRLLSMLSKMIKPKFILEIGTFTGYTALCLAEGIAKNGTLHTIDINLELEERVQNYFSKAPSRAQIIYHLGNALEIIPSLQEMFDLVFIDADKKNNTNYYNLIFDKVRPGGIIIVDNVLWRGKVLNDSPDKDTADIKKFNDMITQDRRVEKLILPIRDGLFIIRKKDRATSQEYHPNDGKWNTNY